MDARSRIRRAELRSIGQSLLTTGAAALSTVGLTSFFLNRRGVP